MEGRGHGKQPRDTDSRISRMHLVENITEYEVGSCHSDGSANERPPGICCLGQPRGGAANSSATSKARNPARSHYRRNRAAASRLDAVTVHAQSKRRARAPLAQKTGLSAPER